MGNRKISPVRIQFKRVKGYNMKAVSEKTNGLPATRVTRPSKFGNPFKIGKGEGQYTRAESMSLFSEWLKSDPEGQKIAHQAKQELRGRNLACYCSPDEACHADILLKTANGPDKMAPK